MRSAPSTPDQSEFEIQLSRLQRLNMKHVWNRNLLTELENLFQIWDELKIKEQEECQDGLFDFLREISWIPLVQEDAQKYLKRLQEWTQKKDHIWKLSLFVKKRMDSLVSENEFWSFGDFESFRQYLESDNMDWTNLRLRQFWYCVLYEFEWSFDQKIQLWNMVIAKIRNYSDVFSPEDLRDLKHLFETNDSSRDIKQEYFEKLHGFWYDFTDYFWDIFRGLRAREWKPVKSDFDRVYWPNISK